MGLIYQPEFIKVRSHFMDSIMRKGAPHNDGLRLSSSQIHNQRTPLGQCTVEAPGSALLKSAGLPPNGSASLSAYCREVLHEHLNHFPRGGGFYPKHFKLPQLRTFIVNPLQEPSPSRAAEICCTLIYKGALTQLGLIRLKT